MKRPRPLPPSPHPIVRAERLVGDRWSLSILCDVAIGIRRFSVLQKDLGIASNILSNRLQQLVEGGLLQVAPPRCGAAHAEYEPTRRGTALLPVIAALWLWAEDNLAEPGAAPEPASARRLQRLAAALACCADGRRPAACGDGHDIGIPRGADERH
jgi:DNA-binding HxlR family transcriptional regulator